ncbi:hypothetical protein GCM10010400_60460 [Streptomyces aculeolatus]
MDAGQGAAGLALAGGRADGVDYDCGGGHGRCAPLSLKLVTVLVMAGYCRVTYREYVCTG